MSSERLQNGQEVLEFPRVREPALCCRCRTDYTEPPWETQNWNPDQFAPGSPCSCSHHRRLRRCRLLTLAPSPSMSPTETLVGRGRWSVAESPRRSRRAANDRLLARRGRRKAP